MTQIHVYPHNPGSLRAVLNIARGGDVILMHAGEYPEALDSYDGPIQGGTSWGTKLTIKPYRYDRVVLRPTSGDFVIRLAHATSSYVEIGSSLVDMEIDASHVAIDGVKITNAGGDTGTHHVRLRRLRVHDAPQQGILVTQPYVEILGGASYRNGHTTDPTMLNKYHGLYLSAGARNCLVRDFSTWDNASYGIHEYGGEEPGRCGRNVIDGGYHVGNGRLAMRAGVLIGGTGTRVRNIVSTRQALGVHVYGTARNCVIESEGCDLRGNRDGAVYVAPDAVGTRIEGTEGGV